MSELIGHRKVASLCVVECDVDEYTVKKYILNPVLQNDVLCVCFVQITQNVMKKFCALTL